MIYLLLIFLSWVAMFMGMIGLFKFKTFYGRILNSSMIDSVAFLTLMFALILKSELGTMRLKLLIICIFFLLTNPIIAQMLTHAAYKSEREKENADDSH